MKIFNNWLTWVVIVIVLIILFMPTIQKKTGFRFPDWLDYKTKI